MQVQLQQLEQVQTERDALHARFEAATADARQAAGAKALLLERKAGALEEALAQREAELEAALAGAGPGPETEARTAGQRCAQVCKSKWRDNPQKLGRRRAAIEATTPGAQPAECAGNAVILNLD